MNTLDPNIALPDPRPAAAPAAANDAALDAEICRALEAGDDAAIRAALALPAQSLRASRLLAAAIDRHGEGIGLRFFAIPLVIVAGARKPCTVAGAVPELHVLRGLLEQHGAIGVTIEHRLWLATQRARCWIDEFGDTASYARRLGRMALSAADPWDVVVGAG